MKDHTSVSSARNCSPECKLDIQCGRYHLIRSSDVLTRHRASHEQHNEVSKTHVSTRAYKQCALDRVRCSRSMPGKRCSKRNLPWCYPATGRAALRSNTSERKKTQSTESDVLNSSTLLATTIRNQSTASQAETPLDSSTATRLHNTASLDPRVGNTTWDASLGDVVTICDVYHPSLGPLGINWISPGYQYGLDWNMIPDDDIRSSQFHQLERQVSRATFSTIHRTNNELCQQSQGLTRTLMTSLSCNSAQTTRDSSSTGGEYYVDGDGPRDPCGGRCQTRGSVIHN
jgi:hypothetical protein